MGRRGARYLARKPDKTWDMLPKGGKGEMWDILPYGNEGTGGTFMIGDKGERWDILP